MRLSFLKRRSETVSKGYGENRSKIFLRGKRSHMNIRKVVIPVAGWGTRSLPASKNIPKEMLPVYNKPVVQYVVEEAIRAGVEDVIL